MTDYPIDHYCGLIKNHTVGDTVAQYRDRSFG